MYSIVNLTSLFCIFFTFETILAGKNGYIFYEVPVITCKHPSNATSPCSNVLDYNIPDSSNSSIFPDLSRFVSDIPRITQLLNSTGGEQCRRAGTKYLCKQYYSYRCEDEYVGVDGKKLMAACYEGRKICSSLNQNLRNSFFNCSLMAEITRYQNRIPRKLNCTAFPILKDDPYGCEGNYKVG